MKLVFALLLGLIIDTQHSTMTVYVYKQGLFSFLADNHEIAAPIASGSFDPQRKVVNITVEATNMRVLDPRLSESRRATIQNNMLGPQVLDVAKYPTIVFRSVSIDDNGKGVLTVTGNLHLHGQTHLITVQVQQRASTHFFGSATVSQKEFGITPIRIAGGAVSVRDEVRVEFDISVVQNSAPHR